MQTKVKTAKWGWCTKALIDCLDPKAGDEANHKARQAIRHMANVLDYHLDQEIGGAEYGETAAVPPEMVELFRHAAEAEFKSAQKYEVAVVD